MQINYTPMNSTSFKGTCTVGRNRIDKILIASNLLASSNNIEEAKTKAKILNETAKTIAEKTPADFKLYIDLTPCEKTSGFLAVLPHRQSMSLFARRNNQDVCIAHNCINTINPTPDVEYFKILAKKITNPNDGYHEITKIPVCKAPDKIAREEALEPILDILL